MLNRGSIEADRHRRPACYCTAAGVRDDLLAQFARSCGQAWTQTGDRPKQVHGMGGLAQEVGSERSLCAAVTRRRLLMAAAPSRRSGRMAPGLDVTVSDWTCPGPRAPASTIASSRSGPSASPAAPQAQRLAVAHHGRPRAARRGQRGRMRLSGQVRERRGQRHNHQHLARDRPAARPPVSRDRARKLIGQHGSRSARIGPWSIRHAGAWNQAWARSVNHPPIAAG